MLVLSRDVGEEVVIDVPPSDVPVRIVVTLDRKGSANHEARIGFDAPRYVTIKRRELLDTAQQKSTAAVGGATVLPNRP